MPMSAIEENLPLVSAIEQFEQVYIPHILNLNIDRKTLYRKLKKNRISLKP